MFLCYSLIPVLKREIVVRPKLFVDKNNALCKWWLIDLMTRLGAVPFVLGTQSSLDGRYSRPERRQRFHRILLFFLTLNVVFLLFLFRFLCQRHICLRGIRGDDLRHFSAFHQWRFHRGWLFRRDSEVHWCCGGSGGGCSSCCGGGGRSGQVRATSTINYELKLCGKQTINKINNAVQKYLIATITRRKKH